MIFCLNARKSGLFSPEQQIRTNIYINAERESKRERRGRAVSNSKLFVKSVKSTEGGKRE